MRMSETDRIDFDSTSVSVDGYCQGSIGRGAIEGVPRPLFTAFVVLVLGGVMIWGIKNATARVDFALLVAALRATPAADIVAALVTTALSYVALIGYDICAL